METDMSGDGPSVRLFPASPDQEVLSDMLNLSTPFDMKKRGLDSPINGGVVRIVYPKRHERDYLKKEKKKEEGQEKERMHDVWKRCVTLQSNLLLQSRIIADHEARIAKLVKHGAERDKRLQQMQKQISTLEFWGKGTPLAYLDDCISVFVEAMNTEIGNLASPSNSTNMAVSKIICGMHKDKRLVGLLTLVEATARVPEAGYLELLGLVYDNVPGGSVLKKKDVSETLKGIQIWSSAKVGRHMYRASHPFMLYLTKDIVEHLLEFIADGDVPHPFDSVDIQGVILAAMAYAASKVQQQQK